MLRLRIPLVASLFAFALTGCGPSDPLARTIDAENATAFNSWKTRNGGTFSAQQFRDLDEVVQELKLGVMAGREATGSAGIDDAVRAKIDKRSVRDVLKLGFESKVARLELERKGLLIATEQNSRLTTKDGDKASNDYLVRFKQKQATRLEGVETELKSAQDKLAALTGAPKSK
jgi:hypothetical protein